MRTAKKRCPKCGRLLPVGAFHFNRTKPGGRQSWCGSCNNQSVGVVRTRARRLIFEEKSRRNFRCEDCRHKFHPWQLDFDHREGTEKLFNLGDTTRSITNAGKIFAEIAKCDLVCANCHRDRTHYRLELGSRERSRASISPTNR